jgi:branched-chain amino acid transport system ATP-binding protein
LEKPALQLEPLLHLRGVRAGYGEAVVLDDVSLEVPRNGSLAVLGRNGVGKSTLLLTVMGYTRLQAGTILFNGMDITALPPHRRAQLGIGWVAQEREIFPSLTLEENLTVAARPGRWGLDAVYELFPRLKERRANMGNQLSGGEQQMLAIARALMTNPALLMLDEPLEGLAPIIIEAIAEAFKRLVSERSLAIVLVEQHTEIALALTQDALLIERGRVAHRARSSELARDAATLERLIGLKVH